MIATREHLRVSKHLGNPNTEIFRSQQRIEDLMTSKRIGAYVGVDPTAPSMHIGHLVPLMCLFWLYVHGFHTVTLVGK